MTRRLPAIALLIGACVATSATASTEAAWRTSAKSARVACAVASGFRLPKVSQPIIFSDAIGRDALLVQGIYRQSFMKGARGTMLCLYDRRTSKTEVSEAKGWSAP